MNALDFEIDIKEVLRYCGHKGEADLQLLQSVESIINDIYNYLSPKYCISKFSIEQNRDGVILKETGTLLKGNDIKKHLENCKECYIFCATIGAQADGFIRQMTVKSALSGLIADAAATAAIEAYCDLIENNLRKQLSQENKYLTWRFSAGYGDLPFEQQPEILDLLNAGKLIGVNYNSSFIMIPSKSVTAIMGAAQEKPKNRKYKCENCKNKNNCNFSCR